MFQRAGVFLILAQPLVLLPPSLSIYMCVTCKTILTIPNDCTFHRFSFVTIAWKTQTCLALLILPESLHHLCLHFFASKVSPNNFNFLEANSNILQHISGCNAKSLYCLYIRSSADWEVFLSKYFFTFAMQKWRPLSSWRFARSEGLLYMPDMVLVLCVPPWDMLFYSIMRLLFVFGLWPAKSCRSLSVVLLPISLPSPSQYCSSLLQSMGRDFHLSTLNGSLFISVTEIN